MTETGHGSDVMSIGTTATYDAATGEIVVAHTASRCAQGLHRRRRARRPAGRRVRPADHQGTNHGVHAVLVPIRDEHGAHADGVTIGDCGDKLGLAGVDNGRLTFDQVRVPRENLLDRYGSVAEDGTYSSPIENDTRRFFTMLGTLVRGRISVAGAAGTATRVALSIATRYALERRQFAAPGSQTEVVLMDYRAHQRRLLPAIATSYALQLAQNDLVSRMHDAQTVLAEPDGEVDEHDQRELESLAAGVKVLATAHATRTIQECREACGGAGYLTENRLPQLKNDTDVFTTFEGDNTVLLQLVAKGLLTGYKDSFESLDTLGTVRFVARQVAGGLVERSALRGVVRTLLAAAPGTVGDGDLRDRAVQLRLLVDRERHVLEGLANRLRSVARSSDPFAGLQRRPGPPAHRGPGARRAGGRRVVRRRRSSEVEDAEARALLEKVCDLHVLVDDRARPGLVHGPPPDHAGTREDRHLAGERAARRAAPARAHAGRGLRHPGRVAGRRDRHRRGGRAAASRRHRTRVRCRVARAGRGGMTP